MWLEATAYNDTPVNPNVLQVTPPQLWYYWMDVPQTVYTGIPHLWKYHSILTITWPHSLTYDPIIALILLNGFCPNFIHTFLHNCKCFPVLTVTLHPSHYPKVTPLSHILWFQHRLALTIFDGFCPSFRHKFLHNYKYLPMPVLPYSHSTTTAHTLTTICWSWGWEEYSLGTDTDSLVCSFPIWCRKKPHIYLITWILGPHSFEILVVALDRGCVFG